MATLISNCVTENGKEKWDQLDLFFFHRISMHSTMMGTNSMYQGDGSVIGSQFKNGSLVSGKGSSFHRGEDSRNLENKLGGL